MRSLHWTGVLVCCRCCYCCFELCCVLAMKNGMTSAQHRHPVWPMCVYVCGWVCFEWSCICIRIYSLLYHTCTDTSRTHFCSICHKYIYHVIYVCWGYFGAFCVHTEWLTSTNGIAKERESSEIHKLICKVHSFTIQPTTSDIILYGTVDKDKYITYANACVCHANEHHHHGARSRLVRCRMIR